MRSPSSSAEFLHVLTPSHRALSAAPRLLDLVRQVALACFGQDGPGERYAHCTRLLILFHDKRHPRDLSPGDVGRFLEHLAHTEKDPLNCLEQAHTALTFLYRDVLGLDVGDLPCPEPPRLLDRLRRACRVRQLSPRTENCYAGWAERFIRFHGLRPPNTMGAPEIENFLPDLAATGHVSASTQNQAFHALLFLYQQVLGNTFRAFTRSLRGCGKREVAREGSLDSNARVAAAARSLPSAESSPLAILLEKEWGRLVREALVSSRPLSGAATSPLASA